MCLRFFFCFFLGPHLQHMEFPRLRVESELQLPACTTATATADLSCLGSLHHGSRQHQILNPRSEARDQTPILLEPRRGCGPLSHDGNPRKGFLSDSTEPDSRSTSAWFGAAPRLFGHGPPWRPAPRARCFAASRPKHLLVFVNPLGGKGHGRRVYERKVAPLFALASITAEIIVTERANHAKESLYELNIDKYDGIVCVGGDGMFSEVLHGLVGRTQRDAGVDQNHPRAALVPSPLRIGIIPAGSTDCVCYSTVGTNDVETSALHIILGDSLSMDVSSVHHGGTLLRYFVSLLGYGFYGDLIKDSEKKRWMGLVRYDFSGLKTFLSHHCYEGTVSFLPAQHAVGSPRDRKPCRAGCFVCRQSRQQLEEEQKRSLYGLESTEEVEEWKVICGQFLAINATNMSCACPRSPRGLSPAAHLGDGSSDLILIRKCSRFNFLRFLVRHTNQGDQFDFTFVEVYRVKKFQFVSKTAGDEDSSVEGRGKKRFGQLCSDHPPCSCAASSSSWNCDGEVLNSSAVEVR
uniref:Ceramide kinase n=1 Tax=Sus scrofa TaxID=9823 RepID=A0A8D0XPZ1_PIG